MIKKEFTLKGSILLLIFILSIISFSKTRVNIDGNINIDFGRNETDRNQNRKISDDYWDSNNYDYNTIGDIVDIQYNGRPFILNGKGYAIIRDRGNLYILQAEFYNSDPNRVKNEQILNTYTFSSNCLAISGDNRYCLTINVEGSPSLWDRQKGRIKYVGRWLKSNSKYYNDYDYYQNSNQSWFEW